MKIVSIVTLDRSDEHPHGSPEAMERMANLVRELRAQGALIDTGGRSTDMLELSVSRRNGRTTITDGPFAESKEVVGGFALLDVKDRDEAIALTNRFLETLDSNATCYVHEVTPAPQ
jgi:hypothetical protein